ncbi:hypothetical protein CDL15_Pgr008462 [Punica granatum]|uniref:Protein kinase domain-containing protein n=1 Tax=Punica granatum TaxID=22663 RepID=A0A218WPJ0_PUNGR|nr:hypothetical protein CDL15_Pgr008462 [Punica granatum]PKI48277.1 hypothetical protein CRG98_031335 [Punica granatum]
MNKFHVYQAIGHGKHSTVYKGRKKKTIEYFAIKSVDKSQKSKILQEVKILHSLDHPNVLKFYSWCESSAHLWLVLEYCVGGDLISLLRQDGQLPEESVYELAYDIVKALQYIHSQGIIYCDLKPSNILLDENGRSKLCDFGLARKSADVSRTPSLLPQAKRGTPSYMAPELFEDGVHSYASDFWALGCVLYECYTGKPPFVGKEFTQLVNSILSDPTPPLPGTPSRTFVNLISSLLIKDPAERIKWPELCGHAFWRTKFTAVPLPPEPAFDSMVALRAKPCLSEHNGDRSTKNKTPPKPREKDARGRSKHDENSVVGARGYETPTKAALSARKMQAKTVGRGVEEKHKDSSKATRAVNLLRLSRIAKLNLQKENDKENYRRPLPGGPENDSEVKIENTDMELNFNENAEDEAHEEQDGSEIPDSSPADNPVSENQNQIQEEDMEVDMQIDTSPAPNVPSSDDQRVLEQESPLDHTSVSTNTPGSSPQLKIQRTKEISAPAHEYDSSKSPSNLSEMLWHPSDLSVRPVMPSRKADRAAETFPSLPFEALPASEFVKMSKGQQDALSNKIVTIFTGNTSSGEKQNVVRYLEMLTSNPDAANILTNGPIMLVLVKLLRVSKAYALRVQFASLIGLLIRHSTFIEDDLSHSGIISSLTEALRDGQEKVRRFSMAALGELLFYISTQNEQNKDNTTESPMKDGRSASTWQVPNSLISLVSSVLRKGEDDLTQLYALRTIENICSQGAYWANRFTSQDVISNLCYIYRAPGKQESVRLTAGSCLVRLVRFSPPSIQWVIEKLSFKDITSSLVKGSPREQQISLNLLNMAMLGSHTFTNIGRHLLQLMEEKNLVPCLISLIEQGTEVLKGKALLLVALLCKNGKRWLSHFFCSAKVISAVDRVAKEKDNYLQQCLTASLHVVASTVPTLLENVAADIQQMMGGRRHGLSPLNSRTVPKTNIHLFPIILNLLGSAAFKHRVVNCQVLQQLAKIIKLVENPFQGRDEFQLSLLRVIEATTEESAWILESSDVFIREILPSLANLYKGNKDADARFLCLKILFDVMVTFFNESPEIGQRLDDLKSISNQHFLPLYPMMIEDEDPIPMYAQKLLLMFIEFNYITIPDILQKKIVSKCFEFLRGDLSNANVNDVKLCLALASAPEIEPKLLSQLKVVRRIGNLVEYVHIKDMEDFIEPTLDLCRSFLRCSVGSTIGNISLDASGGAGQHQLVRDIADFSSNVGVFLELSRVREGNISGLASECLVLLLKAAPREGTAGLLTNLSKVSPILEFWNRGISHVTVQRILQALSYSCRQYLLHGMILSISISEVSKVECFVSEIKSSGIPALASAASHCASELRRLPRG